MRNSSFLHRRLINAYPNFKAIIKQKKEEIEKNIDESKEKLEKAINESKQKVERAIDDSKDKINKIIDNSKNTKDDKNNKDNI